MTYKEEGNRVTLEMTGEDYENLLLLMGVALGSASHFNDRDLFWRWMGFVNRMNEGNPRFTPYEIPEEYRKPK